MSSSFANLPYDYEMLPLYSIPAQLFSVSRRSEMSSEVLEPLKFIRLWSFALSCRCRLLTRPFMQSVRGTFAFEGWQMSRQEGSGSDFVADFQGRCRV